MRRRPDRHESRDGPDGDRPLWSGRARVVTRGSSSESEGVRIAATRAGHHNGDDEWDDDLLDEAWKNAPRPKAAWVGDDADYVDEDGHGGRTNGAAALDGGVGVGTSKNSRLSQSKGRDRDKRSTSRAERRRRQRVSAPPPGPPRAPMPAPLGHGPGEPPPARRKVMRQRRRRRRTLIAGTFLTTVCTFVAGVGYVYVHDRLAQIKRLELGSLAADEPGTVMNVLLVGSDDRAGSEGPQVDAFGRVQEVPGQRSDTIMILHVDPRQQRAAIVSVPLDLYVSIAGANTSDRVNAAFEGGPEQLIATLQAALGITINHYVEVDFEGFKDIVDAVGGVTMFVPYPARDTVTGLALDRGGCVELDGEQGLSWVRSRKMEFLVNGTWQVDGRGDLGRIERQRDFVRRVVKEALSAGITSPLQLNRVIDVGIRHVTFDSALSTRDISALGRRLSSLDADKVALSTLPTNPVTVEGKAVLALQATEAQPLLDMLNGKVPVPAASAAPADRAPATVGSTTTGAAGSPAAEGTTTTTTAAIRPADVKVRVLNGVGAPGAAAKAATSLTGLGFTVADKGDAPSISPKTTIAYASGQLAKAQLLQSSLMTPAVLREDATLRAVDVNLVLGGDYTGVKSGISSGASSASTTVVPTTALNRITPVPFPVATSVPPC